VSLQEPTNGIACSQGDSQSVEGKPENSRAAENCGCKTARIAGQRRNNIKKKERGTWLSSLSTTPRSFNRQQFIDGQGLIGFVERRAKKLI
jgi:hypothetical protein